MAGKRVLTDKSVLKCAHMGSIENKASQTWVKISGDPVLVDDDTVSREVNLCPMMTATNTPCSKTMNADKAASFSALVFIDGKGVCMDTATGMTNWSKLLVVPYMVLSPSQELVGVSA